jgi:hypothetical protein
MEGLRRRFLHSFSLAFELAPISLENELEIRLDVDSYQCRFTTFVSNSEYHPCVTVGR